MYVCVFIFPLRYCAGPLYNSNFFFSSKNQEKFEHDDLRVSSEGHLSSNVILLC